MRSEACAVGYEIGWLTDCGPTHFLLRRQHAARYDGLPYRRHRPLLRLADMRLGGDGLVDPLMTEELDEDGDVRFGEAIGSEAVDRQAGEEEGEDDVDYAIAVARAAEGIIKPFELAEGDEGADIGRVTELAGDLEGAG